jgi:DNA-directed RNA polymerase subunit RPC12/RpoP
LDTGIDKQNQAYYCLKCSHRVLVKISSQIFSVEAPAWQGAKVQEYPAYSELSQRSQAGCIGAKNVKLFLREPLRKVDRSDSDQAPNKSLDFQS